VKGAGERDGANYPVDDPAFLFRRRRWRSPRRGLRENEHNKQNIAISTTATLVSPALARSRSPEEAVRGRENAVTTAGPS
jgi:hypothetical protein